MCPFSHLRCGILFRVSAYVHYVLHVRYIFVVFGDFTINKMWNFTHAAPWSTYLYNNRDSACVCVYTVDLHLSVKCVFSALPTSRHDSEQDGKVRFIQPDNLLRMFELEHQGVKLPGNTLLTYHYPQ